MNRLQSSHYNYVQRTKGSHYLKEVKESVMTVSDGDYQPRKRHYEKEPDTLELDSVITKVKNSA